jgi:hypothetical protein
MFQSADSTKIPKVLSEKEIAEEKTMAKRVAAGYKEPQLLVAFLLAVVWFRTQS